MSRTVVSVRQTVTAAMDLVVPQTLAAYQVPVHPAVSHPQTTALL